MRRHLKLLLGSGLLAFSAPIWAETKDAKVPDEQGEGSETESTDVAETPAATDKNPKTPNVPGAKETLPGKVHTVVRGDTLWDLSQTYLGTPWYWPKVWSYNPQIANPHWIYPGNQVRFFPSGDEGPSRVEVGEATEPEAEEDQEISPSDTIKVDEGPRDTVEVIGKIGYTPIKGSYMVRRQGFVTSKEVDNAGTLTESPMEQLMLSPPDKVYFTFKKDQTARIGDKYVIFHTVKEVYNKRTGRHVGFLTRLLGIAKVLGVSHKRVVARLDRTWDEVKRGDLVGPYGDQYLDRVAPKANDRSLTAHVVSPLDPAVTLLGEHHYVLVDAGSGEGVQVGNTFSVIRQSDPSTYGNSVDPSGEIDRNLPVEDIATCMAVDVREKATTCMLIRALREVVEGDRVQMVPEGTVAEGSVSN